MAAVQGHFAPEFLNRLDDIVIFDPLNKGHLQKIVEVQLKDLQERLREKRISLEISPQGADFILAEAYDPVYGARPIRRYLERNVSTKLSRMLLSGELTGHQKVVIGSDAQGLTYTVHKVHERSPSPKRGGKAEKMELEY